jgi:hypothetical protein
MKTFVGLTLVAAVVLFGMLSPTAQAADKPVKASKEWTGSVADAKHKDDAPTCITSAKELEKLWKSWKVTDKVPEVDFTKEIVVIATTSGSRINLSYKLSDKGNLQVLGVASSDFGEGFRYVIASVSNEGVKTVDGKELPK